MSNLAQLDKLVEVEAPKLSAVLPPEMAAQSERFLGAVYPAFRNNRALQNCAPDTVIGSLFKAFRMGLLVDGVQAALVPYGNQCTFVAMYQGLLDAVRRSGDIRQIWAEVVYLEDEFRLKMGVKRDLDHVPCLDANAPRQLSDALGAYCVAVWKDGTEDWEWVPAKDILAIKSQVKASKGPWFSNSGAFEAQMWKKTAIRRLCKRLPMPDALREYIKAEDDMAASEGPREAEFEEVTGDKAPETLNDLAGALNEEPPEAPQEPSGSTQAPEGYQEPSQPDLYAQGQPEAPQAPAQFPASNGIPKYTPAGAPTKDVEGLMVAHEALPWELVREWPTGSKANQFLVGKTWGDVGRDLSLAPALAPVVNRGIDMQRKGQQVPVQHQCAALALQQINAALSMEDEL